MTANFDIFRFYAKGTSTMKAIVSILYPDPQQQPSRQCPTCGGCVYGPSYFCIRCERDGV